MWFKIEAEKVTLRIMVKPNAKKTAILSISDTSMHIAIHAKPHKGEANQELLVYLSRLLQIPKSKITITMGEKNKFKVVKCPLTETIQTFLNQYKK